MAEVRRRQFGNVHLLPQQDRKNIPALVAASDVCLVPLKRSEVFKTVIPTKMLEFMACAKPIVLSVQGQASELLKAAGAGICVPPQDPSSMVAAIRQLSDDRDLCRSLGQNGRNYIVENLSRGQTAENYIGLLKDITSPECSDISMSGAKAPSATRA